MGREVKDIIIHVKILLYHLSDPVYDEGSRDPDETNFHTILEQTLLKHPLFLNTKVFVSRTQVSHLQ